MTYPDKPAPAAYRPRREVAAGYRITNDFKKYTFTLRGGFRFSDGTPVRANAFANAINRALQPFVNAAARSTCGTSWEPRTSSGKRRTARGVGRGNSAGGQIHAACSRLPGAHGDAVLLRCPAEPAAERRGVGDPSAGPYYVQEYRPNERIVLKRNPYYGGNRKVHLDGFEVDLQGGTPQDMVRKIDRGEADWGPERRSSWIRASG